MKKNYLFLVFFISVLSIMTLIGCKGSRGNKSLKELQESYIQPTSMTVDKSDTTEVMNLVNAYFDHLKAKNVEGAIAMTYYLDKDEVKPLTDDLKKRQRIALSIFAGMDYAVDYLIFNKETDSEVKYTASFKSDDPKAPTKQSFIIKPVRRNGKWYLTLADTKAQKGHTEVEKFN